MKFRIRYCLLLVLICICSFKYSSAKTIHDKRYKLKLTLPETMKVVSDATDSEPEETFYDSTIGIVLIISGRKNKFKSVKEYIDCTKKDLEHNLRLFADDSTLVLLGCQISPYYPQAAIVMHFCLDMQLNQFDTYMMYFIHYRKRDIQLSFSYKGPTEQKCLSYIDDIMKTLRLKDSIITAK